MTTLLKSLSFTAIFLVINQAFAGNLGHRLGSDYHKNLPENSLIVFEASILGWKGIEPIMNRKKFKYAELDVSETLDGELIVFHDEDLTRMLPNNSLNSEIYKSIVLNVYNRTGKKKKIKDLKVKDLLKSEIQSLWLAGDHRQHPPTLKQVLDMAKDLEITKPIAVELKYINTNSARDKLISQVLEYKETYGDQADIIHNDDFPGQRSIQFLAWKGKFKKTFPSKSLKKKYCKILKNNGQGGVYRAGLHRQDLCRRYIK